MDEVLERDGWRDRLATEDLIEYEFHRGDDATFRATNLARKGELDAARHLLDAHPFVWRTLVATPRRRKLRNLALRTIIRAGAAVRASRPLGFVLERIGP
jgi:hypothetical protein